ncbi:helix-turn-helix domain-containing protein [Nocardia huaxiensis]|uniref:helix-turn-helix domain-containing protein n=1 Tax=Nocardia huaxiensis TaxID=2755382 RepID=UPI001E344106|nr:helix-turn-helix transcriptional regulator [Nocardia huaxiensis]UFS96720.1 helix-turn-helix transcriptional regulator [Nocardia huaxiensis]
MTTPSRHAVAALLDDIEAAPDAHALFATTSERLRRVAPFDAAVWVATDPVNGLTTAPVRVENLHEGGCGTYWESELLAEHVNLFRDLARARVPVAGLRAVTGDRPEASALYRNFMRPRGFTDELRAVFRIGGRPWGQLSLFRERGRAEFTRAEVALLDTLSTPLAQRLRAFAQPGPVASAVAGAAWTEPGSPASKGGDAVNGVGASPGALTPVDISDGPGMLLFDADGGLVSINAEARDLLAQMPPGPATATPLGIDLPLPVWILSTAGRARLTGGSTRIRIRSVTGRWLVCHASCLRDAEGRPGATAMVIEPAKPSEIAALVVAAYELTRREMEVVELIARGLGTADIAARLVVSPHTVRDHVKAVFDKVGVTSRGELVAKLFTEFQEPLLPRGTVRV